MVDGGGLRGVPESSVIPINALFSRRYIPAVCYAAAEQYSLSLSILQAGQVPYILASKGVQAFLDGSRSTPVYRRGVALPCLPFPPPPTPLSRADGYDARTCLDVYSLLVILLLVVVVITYTGCK